MRKLPAFAGLAAAVLAGTALAAAPTTHVMNVPLPDGSVARVEYAGDVAPKITIAAHSPADVAQAWSAPFPSFAGFDQIIREMNSRTEQMIRQAEAAAHQTAGAAPSIASYANLPAGETSTTIVSVSNGGATCTRTTEIVSQGRGKPPKVTSNVTGQCSSGPQAAPRGPVNPA